MARLVKHEATGPKVIEIGGEVRKFCMCGLSSNKPFCDGSHKQCHGEEDGKTYRYEDGKRIEMG